MVQAVESRLQRVVASCQCLSSKFKFANTGDWAKHCHAPETHTPLHSPATAVKQTMIFTSGVCDLFIYVTAHFTLGQGQGP